jgi:hypothetical protein
MCLIFNQVKTLIYLVLELLEPPLVGRFDSGTPGCPGKPFAPAEVDEDVPVAAFDGSLIFAPDPPELLISLDLELVAPDDEPELEGLLVPMLPQAARAKTHAKGMIQFFMKDSLKVRKENGISFFYCR